jgi:hypothetical protein
LLNYIFYKKEAIEHDSVMVVSLDRLLFMRIIAMDVQKYMDDLKMMKEYYYNNFRNHVFLKEAEMHIPSYEKNNGIVLGGKYMESINR